MKLVPITTPHLWQALTSIQDMAHALGDRLALTDAMLPPMERLLQGEGQYKPKRPTTEEALADMLDLAMMYHADGIGACGCRSRHSSIGGNIVCEDQVRINKAAEVLDLALAAKR